MPCPTTPAFCSHMIRETSKRLLDTGLAKRPISMGFRPAALPPEREGRLRGLRGLPAAIEQAGQSREETAHISLGADGSVELRSGTVSNGQGHADSPSANWSARLLPLDVSKMVLVQGDTDRIPQGVGTYGSRCAGQSEEQRVEAACRSIIEQARHIAADQLKSPNSTSGSTTGNSKSWERSRKHQLSLKSSGSAAGCRHRLSGQPTAPTFPNGVHLCEVEVDPETGALEVLRYTVVDDVGRVVNPLLVAGADPWRSRPPPPSPRGWDRL